MYYKGEGVPEDYVEAYAWFNIAAAQGAEIAARIRDFLRKKLTPTQLTAAQAMSRELAGGKPIKWQSSKPRKSVKTHKANSIVRDIQPAQGLQPRLYRWKDGTQHSLSYSRLSAQNWIAAKRKG
jgi:TPR repeat protein